MPYMKIRIAPHNHAAYVEEEPDEHGVHHGEMKHSETPVAVRWTGTQWVEVETDVLT